LGKKASIGEVLKHNMKNIKKKTGGTSNEKKKFETTGANRPELFVTQGPHAGKQKGKSLKAILDQKIRPRRKKKDAVEIAREGKKKERAERGVRSAAGKRFETGGKIQKKERIRGKKNDVGEDNDQSRTVLRQVGGQKRTIIDDIMKREKKWVKTNVVQHSWALKKQLTTGATTT